MRSLGDVQEEDLAKEDARQKAIRRGLEELRGKGLPVDHPSPALVGLLRDHFGKGPETDLAAIFLLGRVAHPSALEALASIEEALTDRTAKREVRRSLFKLAQRGLDARRVRPAEEAAEKPVFRLTSEMEGFLSAVDGAGNRMVWLAKPQAGSGLRLLQGVVNDRQGLMQVGGGLIRRRELRQTIREIREKHGITIVSIPSDYADCVLYEAFEKARGSGRPGLERFNEMRAHLSPTRPELRAHPIYDHLKEDEVRSGPARETSQRVLEEPEFQPWILDEDWVQPCLERVREARESRLVLNPLQKEERLAGIVREAVRELFAGEVGTLFLRRMEDMALYLLLTGREDKARSALAVALALRDRDLGGLGVPFLERLMEKSIGFYMTGRGAKPEETSLVIKP